jgi:hypothetical protein
MESIIRNVRDIPTDDRHALEHVIGHRLRENQQIIIQVMTPRDQDGGGVGPAQGAAGGLPAWCNVYEGLSDKEIEEIEAVILDRDHWSRESA